MRSSAASIGKPEGMDGAKAPLPAMAMAAQDQFDGMVRFQEIERNRSMGQQDRVPVWITMRDAGDIRAMSGRIVEVYGTQFPTGMRARRRLGDQIQQLATNR